MNHDSHPKRYDYSPEHFRDKGGSYGSDRYSHGNLPKMHFPNFDGENPKLWQSRSVNYFDMYGVDQSLCILLELRLVGSSQQSSNLRITHGQNFVN